MGEVCLDDGKYGQMAFQARVDLQNQAIGWLSDGCGRDAVPVTVERRSDFPEFACHMGNVG